MKALLLGTILCAIGITGIYQTFNARYQIILRSPYLQVSETCQWVSVQMDGHVQIFYVPSPDAKTYIDRDGMVRDEECGYALSYYGMSKSRAVVLHDCNEALDAVIDSWRSTGGVGGAGGGWGEGGVGQHYTPAAGPDGVPRKSVTITYEAPKK